MKAGEVVFQQLLNGNVQYRVPLFQRTYSWEQDQWERLWENLLDIYAMDKPRNHFIGAVVTQPIPDAPERAGKFMLIDGQQRLTTLFVLLGVIRHQAEIDREMWTDLADEIQETCLTNRFAQQNDERFKLLPTQQDREPFCPAIDGSPPSNTTQIGKAWYYFQKAIQQEVSDGEEIDLRKLKSCITNYLDLVSIKLEQDDSPNRIFESLNNTGVRLSVSDLIRNYLFMNIPEESQQQKAYEQYWYPMQEGLNDEGKDLLSDFFWRYPMMDGNLPRLDETFEGIKELLGDPTPTETLDALGHFARFSRYYRRLSEIDPSEPEGIFIDQVRRLNYWEVDVADPFLCMRWIG